MRALDQQPVKKAVRKSKKSWELMIPSSLKSALGSSVKKAVRKSKKSCEFSVPLWFQSHPHAGVQAPIRRRYGPTAPEKPETRMR